MQRAAGRRRRRRRRPSSMRASTPTSGSSISSFSVRRPCASSASSSGATSRSTAERAAPGLEADVGVAVAVEVELAVGARRRRSGSSSVGVPEQQLLEQVARLGRVEQVGGDRGVERERAHVDAEPVEQPRISGLASWAASGRPSAAEQRGRARRAPRRRPAASPGATPPRPRSASVTSARPSSGRAPVGARPRRRPTASGSSPSASRVEQRDRLGGVGRPRDLGLEHLDLAGRRGPEVGVERLGQPVVAACGTRGSRRACAPPRRRTSPMREVVELDVERRRRGRSTITSAFCADLRLVLGQVLARASASARRGARRCRRGRRRC